MLHIIATLLGAVLALQAQAGQNLDLFGIELNTPARNYTYDVGAVSRSAGLPYMDVDYLIPPVTNSVIHAYSIAYNQNSGLVEYVNGWVSFGDLESCKTAADSITPILERKYGSSYSLSEANSGTSFQYQYVYATQNAYSRVTCVLQDGSSVYLIVDIGTSAMLDAVDKKLESF